MVEPDPSRSRMAGWYENVQGKNTGIVAGEDERARRGWSRRTPPRVLRATNRWRSSSPYVARVSASAAVRAAAFDARARGGGRSVTKVTETGNNHRASAKLYETVRSSVARAR
uniref:Uncharacterized protein n=1 Tax=Oryza sativa subsp. japonica TaxID=39947 RepID=Q67W89_ORYSJ|nr:hypothetical protein [Oryza sativa Japonica Group]BAD37580.1 hypothetical protein [Oryza sativa Japonica Group]